VSGQTRLQQIAAQRRRASLRRKQMKYAFAAFAVLVVAGLATLIIWGIAQDSAGEERCHQAGGHWVNNKSSGEECWVGHKIKV
jgi:hypothetical protein